MRDECKMVNLPSLLGRDDSRDDRRGAFAKGRCRVRSKNGPQNEPRSTQNVLKGPKDDPKITIGGL